MDHIQKIIQQLNGKNSADKSSISRNDESVSRVRTARTPRELNTPVDKIIYTQTEQIAMGEHELAERRLIAGIMDDPRNTPFKILRTQVLHELKENNWTTIAINSATQGAGKSFVASNLAVSIALEVNYTVLLVDLDLRRPRVHKYFGIEPQAGLQDYLKSDVPLSDILVNPGINRLVLLPGSGTTGEASELLSSPKMINLVDELKNRYESRIIIYDLPPLLAVDDARVILPYIDANIFVAEDGKNTEDEIIKSLNILDKTNLIGTVLNKSSDKEQNYSYQY